MSELRTPEEVAREYRDDRASWTGIQELKMLADLIRDRDKEVRLALLDEIEERLGTPIGCLLEGLRAEIKNGTL